MSNSLMDYMRGGDGGYFGGGTFMTHELMFYYSRQASSTPGIEEQLLMKKY